MAYPRISERWSSYIILTPLNSEQLCRLPCKRDDFWLYFFWLTGLILDIVKGPRKLYFPSFHEGQSNFASNPKYQFVALSRYKLSSLQVKSQGPDLMQHLVGAWAYFWFRLKNKSNDSITVGINSWGEVIKDAIRFSAVQYRLQRGNISPSHNFAFAGFLQAIGVQFGSSSSVDESPIYSFSNAIKKPVIIVLFVIIAPVLSQ